MCESSTFSMKQRSESRFSRPRWLARCSVSTSIGARPGKPAAAMQRTIQRLKACVVMVRPNSNSDSSALRSETRRSEEHTSELQSLMRISYAVFCLKKKNNKTKKEIILRTQQPNQHTTQHTETP